MLIQLLLALLEIVVVLLLLALLSLKLALDLVELAVECRHLVLALLEKHVGSLLVHLFDLLLEGGVVLVDLLHLLQVDLLVFRLEAFISLQLVLVLWGGGVDTHQEERVFVMLLDDSQGPDRVLLDVFLYLLYRFAVFLLASDISFLFVSHAVLQPQSLNALQLKSIPRLPILSLPILCCHRTL